MKCPGCGAEGKGKFCEYCGSKLPQETPTINVTNNYYTTVEPRERPANSNNAPVTNQKPARKTWLWVLGWIFIFPVPLTILLVRQKDMKPVIKYGIIALVWVLYLIIGYSGNSDTSASDTYSIDSEYIYTTDSTTFTPVYTSEPTTNATLTTGQKNALGSADSYLRYTAFSYTGLIDQLEYEGYTNAEATFAADNCGADWFEQAEKSADSYLRYTAFSYTGLIDQLEYEGFTAEQAKHGADNCGADWFEQAALSAENYLKYTSFSRQGLIDQLEYEGFTYEQAVYGVEQNGY